MADRTIPIPDSWWRAELAVGLKLTPRASQALAAHKALRLLLADTDALSHSGRGYADGLLAELERVFRSGVVLRLDPGVLGEPTADEGQAANG